MDSQPWNRAAQQRKWDEEDQEEEQEPEQPVEQHELEHSEDEQGEDMNDEWFDSKDEAHQVQEETEVPSDAETEPRALEDILTKNF